MFHKPLADFDVAYFIFPYIGCHSFWNKNVSFPLSLAFLDENNKILDFKDMDEQNEKSVSPESNKVKFVVEANKGIFDKLKLKKGDILIPEDRKLILKRYF